MAQLRLILVPVNVTLRSVSDLTINQNITTTGNMLLISATAGISTSGFGTANAKKITANSLGGIAGGGSKFECQYLEYS